MTLITGFTNKDTSSQIKMGTYAYINANDSVLHILNHPVFDDFGRFILPVEINRFYEGMRLKNPQAFSFSGETLVRRLQLYARGIGTNAEGWIEHAIQFWKKQLPE